MRQITIKHTCAESDGKAKDLACSSALLSDKIIRELADKHYLSVLFLKLIIDQFFKNSVS